MRVGGFWQDRGVLVTGGAGLIGSWLVNELLDSGARVAVLVKDYDPQSELIRSHNIERVSVVNGTLESYADLERAINLHETETVFHLGAQTIVGVANRNPLSTFESNVRGTYNLLEACRMHRSLVGRIVVASSDKAYGDQAVLPYTEDMPLNGLHPYDASKACTDILAQTYFHTYRLPVAITRCGNVYGGGDLNWSRIVPGSIRALAQGSRPIIRSDGKYLRDYIYVKDVARAYLRVAECLDGAGVAGQAFNFSPECPVSVLDVAAEIRSLMGCEHLEPDIRNTATAEIRDQYLCTAKARDVLGWAAQYSLNAGLRETIEWYMNFFGAGRVERAWAQAV